MGKIFITSDSHFNNAPIIQYCNRPFTGVEHQTEELIRLWNSVVSPEDTVIHLGDFIMGKTEGIPPILSQLNGHIILVRGNHDTNNKLKYYSYTDKVEVHDLYTLQYKNLFFIFCHFPITNESFGQMITESNSEVIYCHGHVHDKSPFYNAEQHSFNCCVDVTDFTPVHIDKIYGIVKQDFITKGVWCGTP